jgi:hypothetical protein
MGDRFTFGFVDDNGGDTIYLYSHYDGQNAITRLANALQIAEPRWNDVSYGNRIAISNIIKDEWTLTTGYGLSVNQVLDHDYPYVLVTDFATGYVTAYRYNHEDGVGDRLCWFRLELFCGNPVLVKTTITRQLLHTEE